jgi:hypothetical protein
MDVFSNAVITLEYSDCTHSNGWIIINYKNWKEYGRELWPTLNYRITLLSTPRKKNTTCAVRFVPFKHVLQHYFAM